jgi:hypothetical protein
VGRLSFFLFPPNWWFDKLVIAPFDTFIWEKKFRSNTPQPEQDLFVAKAFISQVCEHKNNSIVMYVFLKNLTYTRAGFELLFLRWMLCPLRHIAWI